MGSWRTIPKSNTGAEVGLGSEGAGVGRGFLALNTARRFGSWVAYRELASMSYALSGYSLSGGEASLDGLNSESFTAEQTVGDKSRLEVFDAG